MIDSRPAQEGQAIRRRRECLGCGARFTTYEKIEREDLRVLKRDGRSEPFDRYKLVQGVFKACEKRPVHRDQIEQLADAATEELAAAHPGEIPTTAIGEALMRRLHELDEVAYIRFASVYRQFHAPEQFQELAEKVQTGEGEGSNSADQASFKFE